MLEIAKKVYQVVTSERFTRIYLMAAITFFGFGILDKPMASGTSAINRTAWQMERTLTKIHDELGKIENELYFIRMK